MSSPPHPTNNNSLDDIFGSSPPISTTQIPTQIHHQPSPQPSTTTTQTSTTIEPSELPFLRRQHVTAGYRDGVSASKGDHVQSGFDAGFPVGAQLGMRAGAVLGILEGILRGYESRAAVVKKQPMRAGSSAVAGGQEGSEEEEKEKERVRAEKRERVLKVYQDAMRTLDVRAVFAGLGEDEGGVKPEE
ncbi:Essential protein Yae1, N terminal, partial [Aspergillus hancockii]